MDSKYQGFSTSSPAAVYYFNSRGFSSFRWCRWRHDGLISNRVDDSEEAASAYTKRWKIEVFYRTTKQNLGLTSYYAQSETAHFAHVELLFTAKTLLCYATWECNKEGAEQAPSLCEVMRYFFNAGCRIRCSEQLIQVYFDTATERFSRLIDKFWPQSLELRLWSWEYYPGTA
ncbi:MAG: hypothetical protein QHH10_12845 [Peptococcaceae bacterium]|nr:hypothetical protein [Peptococcaceae bacterium]MDH7526186.1 hypothetical protein [Peptococcaceae bacterium]